MSQVCSYFAIVLVVPSVTDLLQDLSSNVTGRNNKGESLGSTHQRPVGYFPVSLVRAEVVPLSVHTVYFHTLTPPHSITFSLCRNFDGHQRK